MTELQKNVLSFQETGGSFLESDPLVHMRHLRAAGYCASGARAWFARHQIELRRLREGIPASELEATGDAMAHVVCKIAREEK